MKILHTSIITGIAGSENYLLKTLPALNELENIDISFVALTPKSQKGNADTFLKILENSGVKTHIIYFSSPYLKAAKQLNRLTRNESFDILHSHLLHADIFAAIVKRYLNKKIHHVSTKHGYQESYNNSFGFDPGFKKKNLYWRLAKWAEQKVTKSYAISKGLQHLYIGLGICKKNKLDLLYYGFDFNIDGRITEKSSILKLVMVGRLTAFKGHRFAIEACEYLTNQNIDFSLDIIGNGELENELKALTTEKKLDKQIHFLGYQANASNLMIDADIVLIPSVAEGFGVVVLEAMAAKSAIIAFDVPAVNEILIDNETGLLAAPHDPIEYAKKIVMLSENYELRVQLVKNAHERLINYFCLNRMITETSDFYVSVNFEQ